jgi:tetratricopeptide (TPR) repeat protein
MRGWWSFLMAVWWTYLGMLGRAVGNASGQRGAYQWSVRCLSRAIAYTPEEANPHFWRGTLYWREFAAYEQAAADLSRAIELNPDLVEAYLNRAFVRQYTLPPDRAGAMQDLQVYLDQGTDPYWRGVAQEQLDQLAKYAQTKGSAP